MREWCKLPIEMQCEEIKQYYDILRKRKLTLRLKRAFDVILSGCLLILLSPVFVIVAIWIKSDSDGPVFFCQNRVTAYGITFKIIKFRTMITDADKKGTQVTKENDIRITNVGKKIRRLRLDEIPQLINVIKGDMTFVGTRPEVPKYVKYYTNEMRATLLLPAGITSRASIEYKDEDKLLSNASNVDAVYVEQIMPEKMKYNLQAMKEFSVLNDLKIMIQTVAAVLRR